MSILEGIKVVELCEVYQGPLAGQSAIRCGWAISTQLSGI
jgi:crotonobetainyl-CoA:carnitine CoA-transferase CaiB-like acyl-CoA transferase